jgi:hypothetical protein
MAHRSGRPPEGNASRKTPSQPAEAEAGRTLADRKVYNVDAGFGIMRVGRGGIEQDRAGDEGKAQEV